MSTIRLAATLGLCALVLVACDTPQAPAAETAPITASPASMQQATTSTPSPFATSPTAATAASVDNYEDLLRRYPTARQQKLKAWYASAAPGAMSFHSAAQWKWMQHRDYPTPDDVLRASAMTDAQLRELASHGDTKANFFHLARLLDNYAQAQQATSLDTPHKAKLRAELSTSMDRALASGSAFAGYMYGPYYAALHGGQAAGVGRAAGLMWALGRGDTRAEFAVQFSMGFPGVSGVGATELYFDMFATTARLNPYFRDTYRGRGTLVIPLSWQHKR